MQHWTAKLLHRSELVLGEGAHWHSIWCSFLYVDIVGKKVGRIDPLTAKVEQRDLPAMVGTVTPWTNDWLLVALQGSIAALILQKEH